MAGKPQLRLRRYRHSASTRGTGEWWYWTFYIGDRVVGKAPKGYRSYAAMQRDLYRMFPDFISVAQPRAHSSSRG